MVKEKAVALKKQAPEEEFVKNGKIAIPIKIINNFVQLHMDFSLRMLYTILDT